MHEEINGVKILALATVILIVLSLILRQYHPAPQPINAPSLPPLVTEPSATPIPTPMAIPQITTPKTLTYTNKYFSLNYPESWNAKIVSPARSLVTWQATTPTTTLQITVSRASYTYQSYQYHVSSISNMAKRGEIYSSITETKLSGVTALSYTHTMQAGESTQIMWLEKGSFEYSLTWNITNDQDEIESLLRSFVLP